MGTFALSNFGKVGLLATASRSVGSQAHHLRHPSTACRLCATPVISVRAAARPLPDSNWQLPASREAGQLGKPLKLARFLPALRQRDLVGVAFVVSDDNPGLKAAAAKYCPSRYGSAIAQAGIRAGEVPGLAIAVVLQDEVIYLKGFGVREAGKDAAVDPDTVFQLASCSKPISATVVAALVSDGAVSWDTRIADTDPGFRLHDAYPSAEVTIRGLFAHRSGLPGDASDDLEELGFSRDEILHRIHHLLPSSSFRAGYADSNVGLTEGAVAAARAAGLSWEDAADAKLFKPLGMASTSAGYAEFLGQSNRAALHIRRDGRWQALLTRDPDAQ